MEPRLKLAVDCGHGGPEGAILFMSDGAIWIAIEQAYGSEQVQALLDREAAEDGGILAVAAACTFWQDMDWNGE